MLKTLSQANLKKFAKNKWDHMTQSEKQPFIIIQKMAQEDYQASLILDGDALVNNLAILEN